MPVDTIARAQAGAANASAVQALSRSNSIELFAQFGSLTIDASISTVTTTGYAAAGLGRGVYVADVLATAALAAQFPAFCRKTANNRYFRLTGTAITPEQAGATGRVGTNDRPAIQAVLDYATAMGIPEVHLMGAYEAWCPQRTSPLTTQADDGHLLVIRGTIAIIGLGAGATINRRNWQGADPINQQPMPNPAEGLWRGGGLFWTHSGTIDQNTTVILKNLKLDGGINRGADSTPNQPIFTQDGWDTTDKGIWVQDLRSGTLIMEDVELTRFRGEINYWAGYSDATSTDRLSATRCWFHIGNGDANNAQGGYAEFHHCRFGDAHSAAEELGRSGHRYYDCEFYNCVGVTFLGGPDPAFQSGYFYSYPFRKTAYVPWIELADCTFNNCGYISIGNWVRGHVTCVDTYLLASSEDCELTANMWLDNLSGLTACIVDGPPTLTTQFQNCPAGTYVRPPSRMKMKVNCYLTKQAADAGRFWAAVYAFQGIILRDSCSFTSDYAVAASQWVAYGSTANMVSVPAVTIADYRLTSNSQRGGGIYDTPAGDTTYCPTWPAIVLYPSVQQCAISLTDTNGHQFVFDNNATVRFINGDNSGKVMIFPFGGAMMALKKPRALSKQFDYIDLAYDKGLNKWVEVNFGGQDPVPVTLTDAATVAVNFGYGANFELTLAGNRTLANPTNTRPGQSGVIRLVQDATGGRTLTYGTNWRFAGGATSGGALSTAANAIDVLSYLVGTDGLVYATLSKSFAA